MTAGEGRKSCKNGWNQAPVVFPSSCKILKTAKYIDSFETADILDIHFYTLTMKELRIIERGNPSSTIKLIFRRIIGHCITKSKWKGGVTLCCDSLSPYEMAQRIASIKQITFY